MRSSSMKSDTFKRGLIYCVILNYLNLSFKKKYNPGKEQIRLKTPYIIATLILTDADNPRRKEIRSAVNSLTPHPPILTGKVIENNIIGEKTRNET